MAERTDTGERPLRALTGAARGIGAACARALAAEGFRVAVPYGISAEAAEKRAGELPEAFAVGADLADPARIDALVAELGARVGRVDRPVRLLRIRGARGELGSRRWQGRAFSSSSPTRMGASSRRSAAGRAEPEGWGPALAEPTRKQSPHVCVSASIPRGALPPSIGVAPSLRKGSGRHQLAGAW